MRRVLPSLVFLVGLLHGAPAAAEQLRFDFAALTHRELDLDDLDVDGDGLLFELSLELKPRVHLFAEYGDFDFDRGLEAQTLQLGAGYSRGLRARTDWYATVAYAREDVRVRAFDDEDDGYAAAVGVRALTADGRFEVGAELEYVDVVVREDNVKLTGLFNVGERISLVAAFVHGDDITVFGAGLRFYFSR